MRTRTQKQEHYFKKYFEENRMNHALKALELVNEGHVNVRKDGSEERSHLFEVMGLAIAMYDKKISSYELELIVCCNALHDLVEDYPEKYSFEFLAAYFPIQVIDNLQRVTKWEGFKKEKADYDKYHGGIGQHFISTVTKACDRIHNLSSCHRVFTLKRKREYIKETEDYIIPNLKKWRKEDPTHYSVYTFLVLQLKKEIEVLNYICELEEKVN